MAVQVLRGVPSILIDLFAYAQRSAIKNGDDQLTQAVLVRAYKENMNMVNEKLGQLGERRKIPARSPSKPATKTPAEEKSIEAPKVIQHIPARQNRDIREIVKEAKRQGGSIVEALNDFIIEV